MSTNIFLTVLYIGKNKDTISLLNDISIQGQFLLKTETVNSCDAAVEFFSEVYRDDRNKTLCVFDLGTPDCENMVLRYINTEFTNSKSIVLYRDKPWTDSIELLSEQSLFGMIDAKNTLLIKNVLINALKEMSQLDKLEIENNALKKSLQNLQQELSDKKIDLLKKNIALQNLSVTDKLTQLPNRLKIDEQFAFNIESCKRYDAKFSIALLDIDHFKQVNDTYGHQIGDYVLVKLANIFSSNLRQTDMVGRWGGEEFLVLCPNSSQEETVQLAEKLRRLIEKEVFKDVGKVTCSFGVTSFRKGDAEDSILSRADESLYVAKEKGRNRVEVHR